MFSTEVVQSDRPQLTGQTGTFFLGMTASLCRQFVPTCRRKFLSSTPLLIFQLSVAACNRKQKPQAQLSLGWAYRPTYVRKPSTDVQSRTEKIFQK